MAPLLPKLRGQLAEFLNESYPVHLSLLSQPTCVGLQYGRPDSSLEAFLGSWASMPSSPRGLPIRSQGHDSRVLPPESPYTLGPGFPSPGTPSLLRHPFGPNVIGAGPEYQPAVHRLRLSASP